MSGGGATRVSIPNNVRKLIQELKRSTVSNHSDEFLHTTLKDCDMDSKEAGRRLKMVHDIKAIAGRKHSDEFVYTTLKDCGMDPNEAGRRLKTIHDVKEIAGKHSVDDIYTMLKDCNMDPNEAVQRLLYIDTFQEVKKKERRKSINRDTYVDYRQRQGNQYWRNRNVNVVTKATIPVESVKTEKVVMNGNGTLPPPSSNGSHFPKLAPLPKIPAPKLSSDTVVVSSKKTCAVGSIQCEIVKRSKSMPAVVKSNQVCEKTRKPKPDVVEKIVSLSKPDSSPVEEQLHEPVKEVMEKVSMMNTDPIPEEKPEAHQQAVVLPDNLHVPEDIKKHFVFGSLNAASKSCQQKVPVPEEAEDTSSSDPDPGVETKKVEYPAFQRDYGFSYMPHPHFVHPDSGSSVTASGLGQGQGPSQSQSQSPRREGGIAMTPPYYKQAYANYYMNPYLYHLPQFPLAPLKFPPPPPLFKQDNSTPNPNQDLTVSKEKDNDHLPVQQGGEDEQYWSRVPPNYFYSFPQVAFSPTTYHSSQPPLVYQSVEDKSTSATT